MFQPFAALHRRLCAALVCAGVAASAPGADRRERKDFANPPPQPVPQEIKVERGQEIVIPLRIYGQRNQQLTFLIRKAPRTGQLGGLKPTGANSAIVHYRSTADRTVRSDVFEYAVKSTEGVSAAVPVQIEIIDRPPELFGPAEVLFPPRLTGSREVQTIELINRGGMTAEGECAVDPPWRLESDARYRIDPGGRLFAKVAFEPEKAGDFLGELRLSSQPDRSVVLRGAAQDALAVKPDALRLATDPATLVRAGVFEITNNTGDEQFIRIAADKRLLVDPELRLPRGRTAPVMIRTQADDAAALDAQIILQAGPHRAVVPVSAAPLPAVIRAVERAIDFGFVPGGVPGAAQLTLRNAGGVAGSATVFAPPPFRVAPQRVELAPGQSVVVPIVLDVFGTGAVEQPIEVRASGGTFSVTARATVLAPGSAPSRIARSSGELPGSASAAPATTPMPASVHDLDRSRPDSKQTVHVTLAEPTRCTVEWHAELSSAAAFAAERRELAIQAGQLAVRWEAMPAFRTERTGERIRGVFENLAPGRRYTVRVLEAGPGRERGPQIFLTSFDTPRGEPKRGKSSLLGVLLAIAAGLGALAWWRRRRPPQKPAREMKKTERIV